MNQDSDRQRVARLLGPTQAEVSCGECFDELTPQGRVALLELLRQLSRTRQVVVVTEHEDVALVFPVHPNPAVVGPAADILAGHPRIHLIAPLRYDEFVVLLSHAWLIVSDSGGVQEEAPTLRKRLLVLRENTERPEVIESGVARLVGGRPERLALMLDESYRDRGWSQLPHRAPVDGQCSDGPGGSPGGWRDVVGVAERNGNRGVRGVAAPRGRTGPRRGPAGAGAGDRGAGRGPRPVAVAAARCPAAGAVLQTAKRP